MASDGYTFNEDRVEQALAVAFTYGNVAGGTHLKQWVIDQMVRKLTGFDDDDGEHYRTWVACVGYDEVMDEYYPEWSMGVAP